MTTMPMAEQQQERVSARTADEHDALVAAMQQLDGALVAAAPGREAAWASRVAADLRDVRSALEQHRASAEGAGGLFAELQAVLPAASYRLGKLRQGHAAMLDETDGLLTSIERMADDGTGSFDAIRRRVSVLLSGMRAHQAQEVDLIYEAFCRDLGALD